MTGAGMTAKTTAAGTALKTDTGHMRAAVALPADTRATSVDAAAPGMTRARATRRTKDGVAAGVSPRGRSSAMSTASSPVMSGTTASRTAGAVRGITEARGAQEQDQRRLSACRKVQPAHRHRAATPRGGVAARRKRNRSLHRKHKSSPRSPPRNRRLRRVGRRTRRQLQLRPVRDLISHCNQPPLQPTQQPRAILRPHRGSEER